MKQLLNQQSKVILFLYMYILLFSKLAFADVETTNHRHAVSIQIGENGITGDWKSFGLQFFPPDLSYSYKFFDNNKIAISTSTFYDNIGVNPSDSKNLDFTYRLGQRIDIGYEFKDTLVYTTLGIANMFVKNKNGYLSPVYGFGVARDISNRFAIVTELNFQDINMNGKRYNIANASVGLIFNFDL